MKKVLLGLALLAMAGCETLDDNVKMGRDAYCSLPEETRQKVRDKATGGEQWLCLTEGEAT